MEQVAQLSDREILALAITLEAERGRFYSDHAEALQENCPASAKVFVEMAEKDEPHRRKLVALYQEKFGEHMPTRSSDPETDKPSSKLAAIEHSCNVPEGRQHKETERLEDEEARRRTFVLQVVQPGLAGLMDGSVSTLAPLFAAAFATQNTWETFLVGMAASVGAGISMGFAEALSDDGKLTGRGRPWVRGWITGLMTAIGGIGHTIPYLIGDFMLATSIAIVIVFMELWLIAWIRARYMDTKFLRAAFEVIAGGLIVFGAGVLIGNA